MAESAPHVSFVVPAYDEERELPRCLGALHTAARACAASYEIVVADDASTDRTAAVAEEHGARVVAVEKRQIAATRNAGARAARGAVLVFVDADTLVGEPVLRAALTALEDGAVGGGAGVRFDEPVPFYARLLLPAFMASSRLFRWASGCFVFCGRAAYEATGGFDETLFGAEELVFSRALRRQGRVVVLRETVTTSGRKLRSHSVWQVLWTLVRLARWGPRGVRSRKGMEMWYGPRREDPGEPGAGGHSAGARLGER